MRASPLSKPFRAARPLLVGMALLTLGGCGYRLGPSEPTSPRASSGTQAIAVPVFENLTFEPLLERTTTEAIKETLITQGWSTVNDPKEADFLLSGTVTGFELIPLSLDSDSRVVEYRVRVSVSLNLEEVRSQKVLWHGLPWEGTAEFLASNDTAMQRTREDRAIREAGRQMASRLTHRLSALREAP